jgi:hypothetical protein
MHVVVEGRGGGQGLVALVAFGLDDTQVARRHDENANGEETQLGPRCFSPTQITRAGRNTSQQ